MSILTLSLRHTNFEIFDLSKYTVTLKPGLGSLEVGTDTDRSAA